MYSEHDSHHEDRRFKYACREGVVTDECSWTEEVNNYDGIMNYNCPDWKVISGFLSVHNSHKEDRIWKFYCCKSQPNSIEINRLDQ